MLEKSLAVSPPGSQFCKVGRKQLDSVAYTGNSSLFYFVFRLLIVSEMDRGAGSESQAVIP